MLTARYDEALVFASALHRNQWRKATHIPYLAHLMAVSGMVLESGGDENQAIAGLLHDAAEDQGGQATLDSIATRFGPDVAAMVADCTDAWVEPKPPWRPRKEAYLAHLAKANPRSQLVSLADKTHNARAILLDHGAVGVEVWRRFSSTREETLWYYQSLQATFAAALPRLALSTEFTRLVSALQRCA